MNINEEGQRTLYEQKEIKIITGAYCSMLLLRITMKRKKIKTEAHGTK